MDIIKRDGHSEPFDITKIAGAVRKSLDSTGKDYRAELPDELASSVGGALSRARSW